MKKFKTPIIIFLAILIPIFLFYKEFNPDQIKSEPHWTYAGEKNVFEWGEDEINKTCGTGKAQSPIDVPKTAEKGNEKYGFHYTTTKFTSVNNGHTIQYSPVADSKNDIELKGEVYHLAQFHFHNPSEHAVGGVLYPMEVHFVHKSDSGKIAVIAVMIEVSETPTMTGYWKENDAKATITKELDLLTVVKGGGKHYKGSLTTPPCTEGVEWLVLDQHQSMTQKEMNEYRELLGSETNRPVNPTNGREITQA